MPKKNKDVQYYQAVGKRKEAIAQVRLYITGKDKIANVKGQKIHKGEILINNMKVEIVYPQDALKKRVLMPLVLTNNLDRFAISIKVQGGGKNGQMEAIIHALARALNEVDKAEYRPVLKAQGLLTRDPRIKERRKVGTGGKARRRKQSPKR